MPMYETLLQIIITHTTDCIDVYISTANGAVQDINEALQDLSKTPVKLRNLHTYQLFIRSFPPQKAFRFHKEGFRFFEVAFDSP